MRYDAIVVGAGIAGICAAWWLKKAGFSVCLVDKKGVLAGASGAAGAFLSPRLGRGGPLQRVTNDAYRFALHFYATHTPQAFNQKGLLRLPKDEKDARAFERYRPFIDIHYDDVNPERYGHVASEYLSMGGYFFPDAAFVDPRSVAHALLEGIDTRFGTQQFPIYRRGVWEVGKLKADVVVLATGAAPWPVALPWLHIGGVWGERCDLFSDAEIPVTLHQKLSVSANVEGLVRIGATHVRNDSRSEIERVNQLLVDAIAIVPGLKDQRIARILAGHRASVADHLPVVGQAGDMDATGKRFRGAPPKRIRPEERAVAKIPGLYLLNGLGGRGFVFAPMMGDILARTITGGTHPAPHLSPDRFLLRHLRHR
ncbi:NAD(P)/FAD-dependent oxidoreductase [Hydrogenimonas sp.]